MVMAEMRSAPAHAGVPCGQLGVCAVAIARRADDAVDHDVDVGPFVPQFAGEADCIGVDACDRAMVEAEAFAPDLPCPPCRGIEDEARAVVTGQREEGRKVAAQCRLALRSADKGEGCEIGQVDALGIDQIGFKPAVGEPGKAGVDQAGEWGHGSSDICGERGSIQKHGYIRKTIARIKIY
jgi:hypothetical protein